jgi:hypothetical protein
MGLLYDQNMNGLNQHSMVLFRFVLNSELSVIRYIFGGCRVLCLCRGCRLAWSRLVDLGSIDPGPNPGSPTNHHASEQGMQEKMCTLESRWAFATFVLRGYLRCAQAFFMSSPELIPTLVAPLDLCFGKHVLQ